MKPYYVIGALFLIVGCFVVSAMAQGERAQAVRSSAAPAAEANDKAPAAAPKTHSSTPKAARAGDSDASDRLEGEKAFRTNCGRCHTPPHKFPPRVMATAIRHMRVRAMITDEEMRLILRYMTE